MLGKVAKKGPFSRLLLLHYYIKWGGGTAEMSKPVGIDKAFLWPKKGLKRA